jgi:hypothetical protein
MPIKRKWKCVTNIYIINATQSEDFNEVCWLLKGILSKYEIQNVSLYKGFNINIISNVLKMKLRLKDINQLLSWYELLTINKVNIVLIHNLKTKLTRCTYKITIVILHMEEGWKHIMCHNPSLRLMTKTKACKVAGQEGSPGVKEKCEGMNSHTPKGASTLAIGVSVDSQIFKE